MCLQGSSLNCKFRSFGGRGGQPRNILSAYADVGAVQYRLGKLQKSADVFLLCYTVYLATAVCTICAVGILAGSECASLRDLLACLDIGML